MTPAGTINSVFSVVLSKRILGRVLDLENAYLFVPYSS